MFCIYFPEKKKKKSTFFFILGKKVLYCEQWKPFDRSLIAGAVWLISKSDDSYRLRAQKVLMFANSWAHPGYCGDNMSMKGDYVVKVNGHKCKEQATITHDDPSPAKMATLCLDMSNKELWIERHGEPKYDIHVQKVKITPLLNSVHFHVVLRWASLATRWTSPGPYTKKAVELHVYFLVVWLIKYA